jgi:hypothetical protein
MSYKRNQIEEAIARIFDPNCEQPPSELRTRIKGCLSLTVQLAANVGLQMLKKPTLLFSLTRHLARDRMSGSRNMKPSHC